MRLTARAVLINNNTQKILLIKYLDRESISTTNFTNGLWVTPGGGLEKGEVFEDALKREIYEETGIKTLEISNCVMGRNIFLNIADIDKNNFYERYYIVKTDETKIKSKKLSKQEENFIKEYKWWDPEEIKKTKETILPKSLLENLDTILSNIKNPIDITDLQEILTE